MSPDLIRILLLLAAAQGLFLALLLATRRVNSAANRILAVAMASFSLFLLQGFYYASGLHREYPHFIGISLPLVFLFGPIVYLYARSVSDGGRAPARRSWLHLLPFTAVVLYLSPFYLQDGAGKVAFLERLLAEGPPRGLAVLEQLQYPHGIAYVVLTIRHLRHHRQRLREAYSFVERVNLLWLRNLTIAVVAVWGVATTLHLLELAGGLTGQHEGTFTALAVGAMVYALGYLGLRQPEIFHLPAPGTEVIRLPAPALAAPAAAPGRADAAPGRVYGKSGLTRAQAEGHLEDLVRLMQEKRLYRRTLLTLPDLARELAISTHNLSEVINTCTGKSFYDFVNGYRLDEVKIRLQDPASRHLTILTIALDAGFNTKSTFNAYFRRQTGLTPSQYRTRHAC